MLAVAGGIIAIVVALVGIGRSYLKNQEIVERTKIIDDNRDLTARLRDAERGRDEDQRSFEAQRRDWEVQRDQLNDKIAVIGRAGGAAMALKSALDTELQSTMRSFAASGGSIYVPVTGPRGNVQGLAFLSIEPFSRENQKLREQIIPLRSLAGRCFTSGKSDSELNVPKSGEHYKPADDLANYRPSSMVNVALKQGGDTVGVLQLLRQEGEQPFRKTDVGDVATMAEPIARQVHAVMRNVDSAKMLGLTQDEFVVDGTILVFDLSRSSLLFQELAPSHALILLNEYFERVCEIAFAAGGTLDTYVGDGALLRFNVPRERPDHEMAGVRAALEMRDAFDRMRDEHWLSYSPALRETYFRVGISTGPLLRANLGHSQVQHLTVLGYPISVAAALCGAAARDRSIVLASEETVKAIPQGLIATPVDPSALVKAGRFTAAAYEVVGLRGAA